MQHEQLERISYTQYQAWLYDVYLKIPRELGFLTYDKAMELAKRERVLRKREEKSLIQKILCNLGLIPCNIKHMYEHYDLALTLMNLLNKDILTKEDVDLALTKSFYDKYFKENLVEFHRYCANYDTENVSKEEYKEHQKDKKQLFETVIPPYGNLDYLIML